VGAHVVDAAPHAVPISAWTLTALTAQSSQDEARREADDLMRRARAAMRDGNLELADWYVGRAELLGVSYESLFQPLVDTPQKLRRELDQLRGKVAGGAAATPPTSSNLAGSPATTAADHGATADDPRSVARQYVERGSQALDRGDAATAREWYRKAVSLGMLEPTDAALVGLADALRKAGVAVAEPKASSSVPADAQATLVNPYAVQSPGSSSPGSPSPGSSSPADAAPAGVIRNPFASGNAGAPAAAPAATAIVTPGAAEGDRRSPLHKARGALAQGQDRAAAEILAQVAREGAVFPAGGDRPEAVQTLVERYRRMANQPVQGNPAEFNRRYADLLLDQAEGLLPYADLELAERLARQAGELGATFHDFERSPQKLLERIAAALQTSRGADAASRPDGARGLAENVEPLPAAPTSVHAGLPVAARKEQAVALLARAQAALDRGDAALADELTRQAAGWDVPEEAYQAGEPRPWMLMMQIDRARQRRSPQVEPAGGPWQEPPGGFAGELTAFESVRDGAPVRPALAEEEIPEPAGAAPLDAPPTEAAAPAADTSAGLELFRQAEEALRKRDLETAQQLFRQAWTHEQELDPETRQRLQDHLQLLRAAPGTAGAPAPLTPPDTSAPLDVAGSQYELAVRKLIGETTREQSEAQRQLEREPKAAWERLKAWRQKVEEADVEEDVRRQLLARIDRSLQEVETHIERNRGRIELDEHNRSVLAEVERNRQLRLDAQNKLAKMVEEFNQMMDQQRYAEAVVLAKQARELDAENPVVQNMLWKSRFAERLLVEFAMRDRSQQGLLGALGSVVEASIPFDDRKAIEYPDARVWDDLTARRQRQLRDGQRQLSEAEKEIQQQLRTKVEVRFDQRPLAEVLDTLARMTGVNVYLDPQGLAAEGITSDTPVSINLTQPISLRSALNLILQPLRLSYVVQDEVLRITSEQARDADVYTEVYNVADLVIPIPNFIPSYNIGLPGAIREAHNSLGYGMTGGVMNQAPLAVVAGSEGMGNGAMNASVLAQMGASGMLPGGTRNSQPLGYGPGGLGGGVQADFDTLIELITATIAPTTWDVVGGPGSIAGFDTNLSLVVSQTQEVHEEIVDLLEQLRRLQDLQVTIEVRFITLNDNFFERIGVDFNFNIDDNVSELPTDDDGPSVTVGLDPTGQVTPNLDIQFRQGSFGAAIPQFGGFDAGTAASIGFAILSDIEAFFLIQAAQGDTRSNVLQAPKVTLFNGQQAFVSDSSQRPFVTTVIPVVGDFAAAHQPVVVVLSEGTSLSVQAVVSNDRRFVRLTLVPFFSKIGNVQEFTFTGKKSSSSGTTVVDPTNENQAVQNNAEDVIEGTTVQLPTFAFTTVTTTVSVPDGGTILLGGIKRLSEGRNERGVPMLSKLPYINRLFKNVGIGRTTQSLMMMVTPRIIIQEEEEEKLGIASP